MEVEYDGKFFVWTNKGLAPSFVCETRASTLEEALRLAKSNPGRKFIVEGVAEKEPAMNKTIWYGAKDNHVRFADSKSALTSEGIDNAQSFTVNGEVNGLNLVSTSEQQSATTQQPQG